MKIILGTAIYDSLSSETVSSIIELFNSGCLAGHIAMTGTLVTTARNRLVFETYRHYPDFTHLLMLDHDIVGFNANDLKKMVEADKPIIAGTTVNRSFPHNPHIQPQDYPKFIEQYYNNKEGERGIMEVAGVAMGCTLIKREVLDAVAEQFDDQEKKQMILNWFAAEREPREGIYDEAALKIADLASQCRNLNPKQIVKQAYIEGLKHGISSRNGGTYIGEDYYFCKVAAKCGFTSHLDLDIVLGHKGHAYYVPEHWIRDDGSTN